MLHLRLTRQHELVFSFIYLARKSSPSFHFDVNETHSTLSKTCLSFGSVYRPLFYSPGISFGWGWSQGSHEYSTRRGRKEAHTTVNLLDETPYGPEADPVWWSVLRRKSAEMRGQVKLTLVYQPRPDSPLSGCRDGGCRSVTDIRTYAILKATNCKKLRRKTRSVKRMIGKGE